MSERVSTLRVVRTLIAVHVTRALRRMFAVVRGASRDVRAPTARKGSGGYLFVLLAFVWMFGLTAFYVNEAVSGLLHPFPLEDGVMTAPLVRLLATVFAGAAIGFLLAELRLRDVAEADAELERLGALPLEMSQVMTYRLLDRAAPRRAESIVLVILLAVIAWHAGWRWASPAVGLVATLPVLLAMAAMYTLAETYLRLRLSRRARQRVDAVLSGMVAALAIGMSLFLAYAARAGDAAGWAWVARVPALLLASPPGLALLGVTDPSATARAQWGIALVLEAGVLAVLAVRICTRLLSGGLMTGSGVDPGVRGAVADGGPARPRRWLSPYQARILLRAVRDGGLRVQVIFALVGGALVAGMAGASQWMSRPNVMAAAAVVAGLSLTPKFAIHSLATEGPEIWLLFCAPWDLRRVLAEGTRLAVTIAVLSAAAVFAAGFAFGMPLGIGTLAYGAAALVGVGLLAAVGVLRSAIDCDPFADIEQNRLDRKNLMIWAMMYQVCVLSLAGASPWNIAVQLMLMTAIAYAYWQQAVEYLPYVLDPVASPPPRVSLSTGLVAVYAFAALQGFAVVVFEIESVQSMMVAFTAVGALVFFGAKYAIWKNELDGGPLFFGAGVRRSLETGLRMGTYAALAGVAWMNLSVWYPALREGLVLGTTDPREKLLWVILAVLAAPIIEEYLFRGLVFGGLRRSMGYGPAALGSALVFAVLHPLASFPGVFAAGIALAEARERTGRLLAPVVAHALYNAVVMGCQTVG